METTHNLNLPLLHQNQAMKEIVINEALTKLDNLINNSIIEIISLMPITPKNGDLYLFNEAIADSNLSKYANHLALYNNDKWEFIKPRKGMIFFCQSLNKFIIFTDAQHWMHIG